MEKQFVLSNFPSIKLSYEKIIHKKVCSDFILAIPHGPKNLIWFTIFDNKNVLIIFGKGSTSRPDNSLEIFVKNHNIPYITTQGIYVTITTALPSPQKMQSSIPTEDFEG